jgi:hypothetical protein
MKCGKCKKELSSELFSDKESGSKNKVCKVCIDKAIQNYENKKLQGLCSVCGKKTPAKGKKSCRICLNKAKENQKAKRENAITEGMCITCGNSRCAIDNLRCEKCINKYKLPIVTKIFRNAKSRAKKSGIEFSIKEQDIILPEYCPILNIKLQENNFSAKYNSYSIDRIDNSKGYVKNNIQIISHRANQIKNDATVKELKLLLTYLESLSHLDT